MIVVDESVKSASRNEADIVKTRSAVQRLLQDLIGRLDKLSYYELLTVRKVISLWLDKP